MTKKSEPIAAGSWRDSPEEINQEYDRIIANLVEGTPAEFPEPKLQTNPRLIEDLIYFKEQFGEQSTIAYPCCNIDISVREAFPNSNITFIDKDPLTIETFRKAGLEIVSSNIENYHPMERNDMLLILNPQLKSSKLTHLVRTNGLIVSNNYHGNTNQMLASPSEYQFLGTIYNETGAEREIMNLHATNWILDKYVDFLSVFRKNK